MVAGWLWRVCGILLTQQRLMEWFVWEGTLKSPNPLPSEGPAGRGALVAKQGWDRSGNVCAWILAFEVPHCRGVQRDHIHSLIFWLIQKATGQSTGTEQSSAVEERLHLCGHVSHLLLQTRVSSPSVPWQHSPLLKPDTSALRQARSNSSWAHIYSQGQGQCVSQSWHDTGCAYQPISLMFFLKSKQKVKTHQRTLDNSKSPDITDLPMMLKKK